MGRFIVGDVVVIPFPFSDLSGNKRRPALVVAISSHSDVILAQITSGSFGDAMAIELSSTDFSAGGLSHTSNIRPSKLFTADSHTIAYKAGSLNVQKTKTVAGIISNLFTRDIPHTSPQ